MSTRGFFPESKAAGA